MCLGGPVLASMHGKRNGRTRVAKCPGLRVACARPGCYAPGVPGALGTQRWRVLPALRRSACKRLPTPPRIAWHGACTGRAGMLPGPGGAKRGKPLEHGLRRSAGCGCLAGLGAALLNSGSHGARPGTVNFRLAVPPSFARAAQPGFGCECLPPAGGCPPGHLGTAAWATWSGRCITCKRWPNTGQPCHGINPSARVNSDKSSTYSLNVELPSIAGYFDGPP